MCYQVLQAGSPVLQQGVEDDAGGSGAVGLGVHQTLQQHEDDRRQLLLWHPLTHNLPHHTRVRGDNDRGHNLRTDNLRRNA